MKKSIRSLISVASVSVISTLYTSQSLALSLEAESLLNSPDVYVLRQSDLNQGSFSHPGTLVIDSNIVSSGIALDAENIIILETGSLQTQGGGSLRISGLYAQDGGVTTQGGAIGIFSAIGNETKIEIDGDLSASSLFVFGSAVSITGDVDLFGANGQDQISIFSVGNTTSDFLLELDVTENVSLQFNNDTNLFGSWSTTAAIDINAGTHRLELSPLLFVDSFDLISVQDANGFFVNTPLAGRALSLNNISGDSVILQDVQLQTIAVNGNVDLIVQQAATLLLNSSFSMLYNGDFTLLGTLKVEHPDPANTASFPFEVWPTGDIIIQGSGRVDSNVDVSLLPGFGSFNTGDFINFGSIEMNLFFETEVSINPAGDFINFGSILLTGENNLPTTFNTFVSGGNTLLNNGVIEADSVNLNVIQ